MTILNEDLKFSTTKRIMEFKDISGITNGVASPGSRRIEVFPRFCVLYHL